MQPLNFVLCVKILNNRIKQIQNLPKESARLLYSCMQICLLQDKVKLNKANYYN